MARFVLAFVISLLPLAMGVAAVYALERYLHLDRATAVGIAVGILVTLTLGLTTTRRVQQQAVFRRRMVDLELIAANWASTISALTSRVGTLEERLPENPAQNARTMAVEIERLSALSTRFSETLAEMQARHPGPAQAEERVRGRAKSEPVATPVPSADAIRQAVLSERTDIFLQPIVTLPQRRPRFYEALVRLRGADNSLILPADFMPAVVAAGLMPRLDNIALFQAVRVLRRISARDTDVGVFCNISPQSLSDGDFFGEFVGFAHANRALADRLVFELSQEAVRDLGPVERESVGTLAGIGYRFSMDSLVSADIDFELLAKLGFRFFKMPTALILEQARRKRGSGDFAETMARFGIDLIADRVETEQEVIDLLDCDVRLGQGYLFAPPRPVRAEMMAANGPEAVAAI